MNRLDRQLDSADASEYSEALLAELTDKLERIASARRAAERARAASQRLQWEGHRDQLRAARNARRRQRYRDRAESHPSGTGRPVRIEVDPTAWRAWRAEAARRRIPAKILLGDLARSLAQECDPMAVPTSSAPRWRRTGAGRRARQSTLVDVDDEAWARLRARVVKERVTLGLLLGRTVEHEARAQGWSTTWPEREATSMWS